MTLRNNSRLAGFAFLVYIAAALSGMVLSSRAASGDGTAAKLASIAQHAGLLRSAFVLELIGCFCALVLAVTLYAITRDEDPDLALLAATFRVAEGVLGAVALQRPLGRLWLATASGSDVPDPEAAGAIAAGLFKLPGATLGATFFAVGSTIFAYLLLRGRIVPVGLAWLGLCGSILTLVLEPLSLLGLAGPPITDLMWLPLLVFEVWLALWLIFKGAAAPRRTRAA